MIVEHAELEGICKGMMNLTDGLSDYENNMPLTDYTYLRDGAQRILDILESIRLNKTVEKMLVPGDD